MQLLGQKTGNSSLHFLYDERGLLVGFNDGTKTYIYTRNLQGDIIAITDTATETVVATYTYDSWGNILTATGTMAEVNPFRYRGYYYNSETGLYALQSRYYDSQTGRFLNLDELDTLTATPKGLTDKNLYAYCDNNPVVREDRDGEFWNVLVGALIGGGLELAGQLISGKSLSEVNWKKVGVATVSGGITAAVGPVGGCLVSGATDLAMDAIDGKINSVGDAAKSFVGGTVRSAVSYGVGTAVGKAVKSVTKIEKIGRIVPDNKGISSKNGYGIKVSYTKGNRVKIRSVELQNHAPHGIHWQVNRWSRYNGIDSISGRGKQYDLFFRRLK